MEYDTVLALLDSLASFNHNESKLARVTAKWLRSEIEEGRGAIALKDTILKDLLDTARAQVSCGYERMGCRSMPNGEVKYFTIDSKLIAPKHKPLPVSDEE